MSVHSAYVESLLNGGGPVKIGGNVLHFQHGAGFGDWVKGVWGKAKNFVANKVVPQITGLWDKHKGAVFDAAKDVGKSALKTGYNTKGSLKDQLKAGFGSVKSDLGKIRDNELSKLVM